eukprot:SAG22_NODE_2809_length_2190_cov_3.879484_5_plen_52_part_00
MKTMAMSESVTYLCLLVMAVHYSAAPAAHTIGRGHTTWPVRAMRTRDRTAQ